MGTIGDNYFDRDIGQYLKCCRLEAGWSQAQVAELLGVTFQQVQKYETGTNRLPASRYPKLAEAINFRPVAALLGEGDEATSASSDLAELLKLVRAMNEEQRNTLIKFARDMVAK